MFASAGTKCAAAAAPSLAFTAANQESVACSGVPNDGGGTAAAAPGEPAGDEPAGFAGAWPAEAAHEQTVQAATPASRAAAVPRAICQVTPQVKHGRRPAVPS